MTAEETPVSATSMARMGSVCSLLGGIIFLLSGAGFFVFQVTTFDWNSIKSISEYLSRVPIGSTMWTLINLGSAIASFLAIGGVLALADRIHPANEGLVRWTSTLAVIGYAIVAVSNIADLYQIRQMTSGYLQLGPSAQSAVEAMGRGSLDPASNLRFLTIGPWFLAAGWLSLRGGRLPKALAYLGVIAGVVALVFVTVSFLELQTLTLITAAMAVLFHPVWLIWTGVVLGRHEP